MGYQTNCSTQLPEIGFFVQVLIICSRITAISVPPIFLKKLDSWAKKAGESRSRFIVEEMDKRITQLEGEEITKLYNKTYGAPEEIATNSELAEEMFAVSAVHEEADKW